MGRCLFTRRLVNKSPHSFSERYINVGCGKCYTCLSNRRRQWLFRLGVESINSASVWFFTLTYEDEHLPFKLCKDHLRSFLDFFPYKFKFYAIGEYGPKTLRPHYHAILFFKDDISFLDIDALFHSSWIYGFIKYSPANYRRLNYVLHYHTRPKEPVKGLKTFQMFSNGLGRDFIYDEDGDFRNDLLVYLKSGGRVIQDLNGNYFVIPRYYTRKLENLGLIDHLPFDCDNFVSPQIEALERHYNTKVYNISDYQYNQFMAYMMSKDCDKLINYDFQIKFLYE